MPHSVGRFLCTCFAATNRCYHLKASDLTLAVLPGRMDALSPPSRPTPSASLTPVYKRALLKLSGEFLEGQRGFGIDPATVQEVAEQVRDVHQLGIELALVVGGGNIVRGAAASAAGMDRASADYMGMLATVINSLALQNALEQLGLVTRVVSAIEMRQVAEPFIPRRAVRHLEKGRIVIFAGGTGSPFFTTDSAAALRACEIKADVLLKATKVDGVYTSDPTKDASARRYSHVTYQQVLEQGLNVMDASAIALCKDNGLPIVVFDLLTKGNIYRVVTGELIGTLVSANLPPSVVACAS